MLHNICKVLTNQYFLLLENERSDKPNMINFIKTRPSILKDWPRIGNIC